MMIAASVRKISSSLGRYGCLRLGSLVMLATCLLFAATSFAAVDVVYTLNTSRPGVTQSFIVSAPPTTTTPTFVVILLAGGTGDINLTPVGSDGILSVKSNNFLVRSRWLFAGQGFYVITLDAATDFLATSTGLQGQQGSANHVADVAQVIVWARGQMPGLPVWVVGTSAGTAGAFVAAQYLPAAGGPDGLVFTDNINEIGNQDSLLSATLGNITIPVLLLNDKGNTCAGTLESGNAAVVKALTKSALVANEQIQKGNLEPLTDPCNALSDHGFFGVEDTTVKKIASWIASAPVV